MAILLMVLMSVTSCSKEDAFLITNDEGRESIIDGENNAIKAANDFMQKVFGNTRDSQRVVKGIEYVTKAEVGTRGVPEIDTVLTVVNFKDDAGFVLMANDKDGQYELFGINDSKSLTLSDTVFNTGLAYYIGQVSTNVRNRIKGIEPDTTIAIKPDKAPYPVVSKHGPYLAEPMASWNQTWPYNDKCPLDANGDRCLAGCVPVAVGMLMAHHKWPLNYLEQSFDWTSICSNPFSTSNGGNYAYNDIATLIATLGNRQNLKTDYGVDRSATDLGNVKPVLRKWGYTVKGNWATDNLIMSSSDPCDKNVPILVVGVNSDNKTGSHMWIEDGFLTIDYYNDDTYTEIYDTEHYYHYVWGWGGYCNGFFKIGSKYGYKGDPGRSESVKLSHVYCNLQYLWGVTPTR